MKIYVATSWRNEHCTKVVERLRADGHEVYDFREHGFAWTDIGLKAKEVNHLGQLSALAQPLSREGFARDMTALEQCDAVVLVLPSGRSAHLEAGFAAGRGKKVIIYQPGNEPPELMYLMAVGGIVGDLERLSQVAR